VFQLKVLDDSAETLGWFSRNSWMIQMKLFCDSA
jgi:putative exporter of polyketide antibiotics